MSNTYNKTSLLTRTIHPYRPVNPQDTTPTQKTIQAPTYRTIKRPGSFSADLQRRERGASDLEPDEHLQKRRRVNMRTSVPMKSSSFSGRAASLRRADSLRSNGSEDQKVPVIPTLMARISLIGLDRFQPAGCLPSPLRPARTPIHGLGSMYPFRLSHPLKITQHVCPSPMMLSLRYV